PHRAPEAPARAPPPPPVHPEAPPPTRPAPPPPTAPGAANFRWRAIRAQSRRPTVASTEAA
ncbi:MAG: hypothetical protein LAT83_15280, partial [Kiritimatiellae bacterium]|nr:hypothetical protein [Kiritimatiellia bacterium]